MKKSNKLPESWCVEITPGVLKHPMYGKITERLSDTYEKGFVGHYESENGITTVFDNDRAFAPEITIDQWCAYTGNLPFDPEKPIEVLDSDGEWFNGEDLVYVGSSCEGEYVFEDLGIGIFLSYRFVRNTPENNFKNGDFIWFLRGGGYNKEWMIGRYIDKGFIRDQKNSSFTAEHIKSALDPDGNPVYPPFND